MGKKIIRANSLFERVLVILEEAKSNVIRTINNNMVIAYWLIGREIIDEIQSGEKRAEYGKRVIEELSKNLQEKFVRGYSITNLRYFRTFFTVYQNRIPEIRHIGSGELAAKQHLGSSVFEHLASSVETSTEIKGFSPNLSWSHYRELMKIENNSERLFYEIEAEAEFWEVSLLKRQIHSFLFARLLKSKDKNGVFELTKKEQYISESVDLIKNPYILDFLGIPEVNQFHESDLEKAIINHIQSFLIELGKGFAFVGRQKRI